MSQRSSRHAGYQAHRPSRKSKHQPQWHRCSGGCDGFRCHFDRSKDIPLQFGHVLGGAVVKVRDDHGMSYALKTVRLSIFSAKKRSKQLRRLRKEVQVLKRLRHRHVVRIRGSFVQGVSVFGLLIRPVADCNLATFLASFENPNRCPSSSILRRGFGCLSSALTFIHRRNIVHGEISPRSILVCGRMLLFADFGVGKQYSKGQRQWKLDASETAYDYAALEMLSSNHDVPFGQHSDVFSLGIVFIEILKIFVQGNKEMTVYGPPSWWLHFLWTTSPSSYRPFYEVLSTAIDPDFRKRQTARELHKSTVRSWTTRGKLLCGHCCSSEDAYSLPPPIYPRGWIRGTNTVFSDGTIASGRKLAAH